MQNYLSEPEWWNLRWRVLSCGEEIRRGDWECFDYPSGAWVPVADSKIGTHAVNATFPNAPIFRRVLNHN